MSSEAIMRLSETFSSDYQIWLEKTDYRGLSLSDMLPQLMKTSWGIEFEKFNVRNKIILAGKGFEPEKLKPAWFVARMFAGGPPTVSQVCNVYRAAFGQ